jgi:hypothetical protein
MQEPYQLLKALNGAGYKAIKDDLAKGMARKNCRLRGNTCHPSIAQ